MLIIHEETDGLYGFGAVARSGNAAQKRRNTHVLSFFAVALGTAVLTVMVAVLPVGQATASPLLSQTVGASHTLGVAAIAAFGLATFAAAIMLLMPALISRKIRGRNRP